MDFSIKTILLIAIFVVPFCGMIASQSVPYVESMAVSERMRNNYGNSDNLSRCDSSSGILANAVGRDWKLMEALLKLTDKTTLEAYINMNYEIIWLQLQRNTSMIHSKIIFKFATYVENNIYLKKEFKKNITQCILDETSHILSELLYPRNATDIELTNATYEYLNSLNETALVSVFNRIYDDLGGRKDPVSIANRLYILPFSNNQLTTAYLELARRNEVKTDEESAAIGRYLIELCGRENVTLRDRVLRKVDTIRIGSKILKDKGLPYYVGLCQNANKVCAPSREAVNVHVERSSLDNKTQYAFKIPEVGYINGDGDTATLSNETFWWDITSVLDILYLSVDDVFLCVGYNRTDLISVNDQFEAEECAWIIELGI